MKANYKSKKCEELVNQILDCRSHNDISGMQSFSAELLKLAEDIQDTYSKTAALFYMSMAAFIQGQHETTISLCMKLLNVCNQQDIPDYHAQTLNMMGIVYSSMSDLMTSLSYLLRAYYYAIEHDDLNYCHFPLNNIGVLFHNLEIPDLALKYFLLSYQHKQKLQSKPIVNDAIPVINIIGANIKLKQYDEAEKWFEIYNRDYSTIDSVAIKSEINIQKIHLCAHNQDIDTLISLVEELLSLKDGFLDQNRYYKILLESLELCIELDLKELAYRILNKIEAVPENISDVMSLHRLSYVKVKMAIQFHTCDNYETLYQYYNKNEEYRELEINNMRQSLLTKIELENMLNEHHQVLMKNERLLKNNELDAFTGVYNKASFKKHVSQAVSQHTKDEYAAMLMIDIDDFKRINDTFGHYVGDQVILDVIGLLTKEIQSSILVGRVGGDEFGVFFSSLYSLDYLYEKVENYLNNTRKIIVNETAGLITISIGVYVIDQAESFDDIYKKADHALYMAKRKGKSQYAVYSSSSDEKLQNKNEIPHSAVLDQFLPTIFKIINVSHYTEDNILEVLRLCLTALNLKLATIRIFDHQGKKDRLFYVNLEKQPECIITDINNSNSKVNLDKFQNSRLFVISNHKEDEADAAGLSESSYEALMQALIVFDQLPLGIVSFYDEQAHLWNERELSILATLADVLAPYIYYQAIQ